jgi:ATP-dependent Clp protease ATP-binding subunit ClpA
VGKTETAKALAEVALRLGAPDGALPTLGERPMKRAIEAHVLVPLAERLAEGEGQRGGRVRIRADDGRLGFDWLP